LGNELDNDFHAIGNEADERELIALEPFLVAAGGKVHGEWPGLDDAALHEGRDLAVATDYRTVLAQVCERHLQLPDADLANVFPEMPKQAKLIQLIKA
jgi:uncharacterized protein (DUF1501 family)